MINENKLALIVSYYFSRFDKTAYIGLGYSSFNEAVKDISKILNVKESTIKNMRDEFDPYHENTRVGWYQRPLVGSRKKVIQSFQDLDQYALQEIVKEILTNSAFRNSVQCQELLTIFSDKEEESERKGIFIIRGYTGLKAEEFFINYFNKFQKPEAGELIDRRHHGGGYDFEINNAGGQYYIEVKGLSDNSGGVLFTDKEWLTASTNGRRYILALVTKLNTSPEILFIRNPTKFFSPKKNIYPSVKIDWAITDKDIRSYIQANKSNVNLL